MAIDFLSEENKKEQKPVKKTLYQEEVKYVMPKDKQEGVQKPADRKDVQQASSLFQRLFPWARREGRAPASSTPTVISVPSTLQNTSFQQSKGMVSRQPLPSQKVLPKAKQVPAKPTTPYHQPTPGTRSASELTVNLAHEQVVENSFSARVSGSRAIVSGLAIGAVIIFICYGVIEWKGARLSKHLRQTEKQSAQIEARFASFKDKLESFRAFAFSQKVLWGLLENRSYVRPVFQALEEYTLPQVRYTELRWERGGALLVTAQAPDYLTLAAQMKAFEAATSVVERVEVYSASMATSSAGGSTTQSVQFDLRLTLRPEYLVTLAQP